MFNIVRLPTGMKKRLRGKPMNEFDVLKEPLDKLFICREWGAISLMLVNVPELLLLYELLNLRESGPSIEFQLNNLVLRLPKNQFKCALLIAALRFGSCLSTLYPTKHRLHFSLPISIGFLQFASIRFHEFRSTESVLFRTVLNALAGSLCRTERLTDLYELVQDICRV